MTAPSTGLLTGWGRTAPTASTVSDATWDAALRDLVTGSDGAANDRGVIARGLGRSYGDAAQNAGGVTVDMTGRDAIRDFDPTSGLLDVEAGASLDHLMRVFVPRGWFVPVTPGTRFVTVGGAIASDIHGKNHHVDGSFTEHVPDLNLLTADGQTRLVSPASDPSLFWATAGGMGLTGVITSARLQMRPVTTSRMLVDTERATDLDDLLDRLATTDDQYTYSVAWIDCLSTGSTLGRSVLTRGWHAGVDDLPKAVRSKPLEFRPRQLLTAPRWVPNGLLTPSTVAAFNEAWYRRHPKERRGEIQSMAQFFHPLDGVGEWNRIYGSQGFVQYQATVPFGQEDTLTTIVERLARSGHASFLAVLKRFGPGNPGHLSYPSPGWTLALDIPAAGNDLPGLLDSLDDLVVQSGGRLYLSKDSRMRPGDLPAMYPGLPEFQKVRDQVDPKRVFASDLSRRLGL